MGCQSHLWVHKLLFLIIRLGDSVIFVEISRKDTSGSRLDKPCNELLPQEPIETLAGFIRVGDSESEPPLHESGRIILLHWPEWEVSPLKEVVDLFMTSEEMLLKRGQDHTLHQLVLFVLLQMLCIVVLLLQGLELTSKNRLIGEDSWPRLCAELSEIALRGVILGVVRHCRHDVMVRIKHLWGEKLV